MRTFVEECSDVKWRSRIAQRRGPDGVDVSDWVFDETRGELDECNGTTIDGQYAYLITDEYPVVSRCRNGEVTGGGAPGGGGQAAPPGAEGAAPPPPPD